MSTISGAIDTALFIAHFTAVNKSHISTNRSTQCLSLVATVCDTHRAALDKAFSSAEFYSFDSAHIWAHFTAIAAAVESAKCSAVGVPHFTTVYFAVSTTDKQPNHATFGVTFLPTDKESLGTAHFETDCSSVHWTEQPAHMSTNWTAVHTAELSPIDAAYKSAV